MAPRWAAAADARVLAVLLGSLEVQAQSGCQQRPQAPWPPAPAPYWLITSSLTPLDAASVQLASGGNDNLLMIWDAANDRPTHRITAHQAAVKALAWCPFQSNLLATGGGTADRTIKFHNTHTGGWASWLGRTGTHPAG